VRDCQKLSGAKFGDAMVLTIGAERRDRRRGLEDVRAVIMFECDNIGAQ
jgi:hypothetical protein